MDSRKEIETARDQRPCYGFTRASYNHAHANPAALSEGTPIADHNDVVIKVQDLRSAWKHVSKHFNLNLEHKFYQEHKTMISDLNNNCNIKETLTVWENRSIKSINDEIKVEYARFILK